tara:strand:- start:1555 stop:1911 length:357 start_codon:yes stop_codon:yes gene_type:complete
MINKIKTISPLFICTFLFFAIAYSGGIIVNSYVIPESNENDSIYKLIAKIFFSLLVIVASMSLLSFVPDNFKVNFNTNDRILNASKMIITFSFFQNQDKLKASMQRLHDYINKKQLNN